MRAQVLATALVVAAACGGCTSRAELLGLTPNEQVSSAGSVLSAPRAEVIGEQALARAHQADVGRTGLAARAAFTGIALRTATATYAVDAVLEPSKDAAALRAPAGRPSRVLLRAGAAYPRSFLTLSRPAGSATDEVGLLSSPDARTPYRVASRALLLPGAQVPATSVTGAVSLPPDQTGLVATPERVVRDYAAVLQTGRSGGTDIADNAVTDGVRANAAGQARGVAKVATFSQRHAPTDDPIEVLQTSDGGALVIGAITRTDDLTVRKGAGYLAPPAAYRALAGGLARITRAARVSTVQVVVFTVPPRGGGAVRLIAFSELPFTIRAT